MSKIRNGYNNLTITFVQCLTNIDSVKLMDTKVFRINVRII